ncbi:hypothetical protein [Blastopirellula retiformator]|uniref:Carboxypeptidase regulatory-like domain-containing protein n=1 Tax=Blastopirellula retiformator TaxID=2527970 RepID=A0A5C5V8F0_9BACT|nr:hypothetical protein [Blastopirellula retiformator]TWT34838.1 hypothetical protein Enr8_22530 [Blastopirellula retiformator]
MKTTDGGVVDNRLRTGVAAVLGLALIASLAGCSGASGDSPGVTPASGTVSYKGKPLEDAFLSLYPVAAASGEPNIPLPRARSKADGTFQLSTYNTGDGAPPGKYQVAVSWAGSLQGLTEEERDARPERLPRKYTKPATSGIVVEIGDTETKLPAIELN